MTLIGLFDALGLPNIGKVCAISVLVVNPPSLSTETAEELYAVGRRHDIHQDRKVGLFSQVTQMDQHIDLQVPHVDLGMSI